MASILWILMWKHALVRMRRFISTPFEILSPCLFFILLFLVRNLLNPQPKSHIIMSSGFHFTESFPLERIKDPPSLILFTPDETNTDQLMDEVGKQLNLNRLTEFPGASSRGYYGLTNDTILSLPTLIQEMGNSAAYVKFMNMESEGEWPNKLEYTIRMKKDFMTHIYEALDGKSEPHENFGTIYQTFMRIQWAIDSSYLTLVTGNQINQNITLQEFPYKDSAVNSAAKYITLLLKLVCYFSLMLPFVFLMSRLIEERASGVQELVKMVGVSNNMVMLSHFLNVIPPALVYCVGGSILLTVSDNPYIPHSNGFLIFLLLALHFISVMVMAYVCSYVSKSTQYAVTISITAYVILWVPVRLVDALTTPLPKGILLLTGLLPHAPMYWFWMEVGSLEQFGKGLTFSQIAKSHTSFSMPALVSYGALLVQICLLLVLGQYLNLVRPAKYGIAMPWNFFLKRSYWTKKKISPDEISNVSDAEDEPISQDQRYFEKLPAHADIGIKIYNVSKLFNKNNRALSNVSFEVLRGEITVLLGHNGAGKTTLMSIITGLMSSSDGKVYVNGKDVAVETDAVRQQMGLCPQHNLFFPHLTVLEHTMFFALLKGQTFAQARSSSLDLLRKLGIEEKCNCQSNELSGGMKRRLQLACALSGDASVIILDEPTSGLDVETRRELWDLLLSLRGNRTVLLTTHFMEEADALGDRVAALHAGRLQCHATPMFLKKNIGTGYRLTLTTIGLPKEDAITSVVTFVVPGSTIKEKSYNSISYNLPAQESSRFPTLFTTLEDKRSELMMDSIGVGVSTLEEVFLRLCSDVSTNTLQEDEVDGQIVEPTYNRITGVTLIMCQALALIIRQFRYIMYKKMHFLVFQFFLPITILFFFTYSVDESRLSLNTRNELISMDLDIYKDMHQRRVMYKLSDTQYLRALSERYKDVEFQATNDVAEDILNKGEEDITEYNKYLAGVELNDTNAKVLFTTIVRHAAPVAMNLLSNILAAEYMPGVDGRTIVTNNYPIDETDVSLGNSNMIDPKNIYGCGTWMIVVLFIIFATLMNTISLLVKERISGTRHIHIMMGCHPAVHWGTTLLTSTVLYTVILVLPSLLAALTDSQGTLNQPGFIGVLFVILLLSVMAFLAFAYVFSFYLGERGVGLFLTLIIIMFGFIPGMVKTTADIYKTDLRGWSIPLSLSRYIFPTHTSTAAFFKAIYAARINAYCYLNIDKCPFLIFGEGFDLEKCCLKNENPLCYFCISIFSPGKEIIILVCQIVVYMALVILIQYGLFSGVFEAIVNKTYRPQPSQFSDDIVRAEKTYVSKAISLPPKQINEAMLVNDVHKNYIRLLHPRTPVNAVKGVSFSVKKGECFGLLGVNGAGKSTTFKMMTAEACATRGNIFANGYFLKYPRENYLESLGYCPQFFGLDQFLTGRQNLSLLLTLRGLSAPDVKSEVDAWIDVVGLQKHKDKLVSGYSGGCQRRLAAAGALAGGFAVTLLDEPTAGVDVGARRRVHAAMRRGLRRGRAIIITSHSMDEMEALCDRITIMSGGELAALGSCAALRAHYAAGHAVIIKLAHAQHGDAVDSESGVRSLKQKLHERFDCSLKDEHKTMLHYHINETMRYSELFTALEQLKQSYQHIIEDYSVTETTLEEVFLSFAQPKQPKPDNV